MARPKGKIDAAVVAKAEAALARLKDSKLSIQLKAIIASAEHPVEDVGRILKVSSRSIFRWITKFTEEGIEGLRDRPKGHMRSKLTETHKSELEHWIVAGKSVRGESVHWTLKKLKRELKKEHRVDIGITPLWKHLKKMGLGLRKPRPVHGKADIGAQEAFKKT
jgi:transposase